MSFDFFTTKEWVQLGQSAFMFASCILTLAALLFLYAVYEKYIGTLKRRNKKLEATKDSMLQTIEKLEETVEVHREARAIAEVDNDKLREIIKDLKSKLPS